MPAPWRVSRCVSRCRVCGLALAQQKTRGSWDTVSAHREALAARDRPKWDSRVDRQYETAPEGAQSSPFGFAQGGLSAVEARTRSRRPRSRPDSERVMSVRTNFARTEAAVSRATVP
jgi:hypothetical protein